MIKQAAKPDRRQVRIQNKLHHLLDLFRQRGPLSKIEAKQRSGYAMSTILALFDRLDRSRFIVPARVEDDRRSRGPRRTFYDLNPLRRLYLGITFTQSGIYSAIVSFSGQVIRTYCENLDITAGREEFLSRLRGQLDTLTRENSALLRQLTFVGVSLPGAIDKDRGVLLSYAFMPYLKGVDFRSLVAEHFPDVPIQFEQNITGFLSYLLMDADKDAQMQVAPTPSSALRCAGEGTGTTEDRLILFVSLRSGLANGVIHDGRIITATGEIAHTQVTDAPNRCVCGRTGCLDIYLSHKALSDAIVGAGHAPPSSGEPNHPAFEDRARHASPVRSFLTIPEIVAAARAGDLALRALIEERFRLLSRAIVNAANLLAPDLIVLSGELFECLDDPAATMRRLADESCAGGDYIHRFAAARLLYRAMGTEASAVGLCYSRIQADFAYRLEG